MMRASKPMCWAWLWFLISLFGFAQPARASSEIGLIVELGPGLPQPAVLRQAIEAELQLPTQLRREVSGPTLRVEGTTLQAIRVSFTREPGHLVIRTLDVSAQAEHAAPVIALLATNLVRDEAGELLAQLTAAEPPPEPEPAWRRASGCRDNGLKHVAVGADFVPYVGTTMRDGTLVERSWSFNLVGGITGAVRGFELGGVFNIERVAVCGTQLSGSLNFVMGDVAGSQLSMLNVATGTLVGAQLSMVNVVGADMVGAQLGLLNFVRRQVLGAQLGLLNMSSFELVGAQVGLMNLVAGPAHGAQVGLVNVATGRAGTMVGLLNVAEDADVAFGLLNVLWKGRAQLDVWGNDLGLAMVGLTQGARLNHNIIGIGMGPSSDGARYAVVLGLGFRPYQSRWWSVDIDGLTHVVTGRNPVASSTDLALVHQLRVPLTFYLLPGLALFVAPSVSVSTAEHDSSIQKVALWGSTRLTDAGSQGWVVRIWPGASVGVRLF